MNKQRIKEIILRKVHGVPASQRNALEHLVNQGITNYIRFEYSYFKEKTLSYVKSMNIAPYQYKYAHSVDKACLYASVYACMLLGMFGEIDKLSEAEKDEWKDYFDSFQSEEDGLFYPPELDCAEYRNDGKWGDGWGKHHLAGHIIIAYNRLGRRPKYRFSCYDKLSEKNSFDVWIKQFKLREKAWSESNYIMNAYMLLQYNRDQWGDKKAECIVEAIKEWLKSTYNVETGMWNQNSVAYEDEIAVAIRAAYHLYPLFLYDGENELYVEKTIDLILQSQNSWGGFTSERSVAGACEDIDAVDPLLRAAICYPEYRKEDVKVALSKSLIWILSNYNSDGGATFYIENEHHYGDHPMTTSLYNESNLFATWFRTLCIAYMCDYLNISNNFDIMNSPGYEIQLRR